MQSDHDHHPHPIAALLKADSFEHPVDDIKLVETHISWVILTGQFAYKIKKPVDLGFVDFSSLEKRRFYCEEEVRLNRRLAPDIYLEVVPITRSPGNSPLMNGKVNAIEYAVKMMQFPWEAQLDRILDRNELKPFHLDAFAQIIAIFHKTAQRAATETAYGDLEHLSQPVYENFSQIRDNVSDKTLLQTLVTLETRSHEDIHRLEAVFDQRKADGFIRECHGDVHLRNMAWVRDKPLVFDCIEFNPNLRWIDVISEIAFLVMDLEKRKQSELAYRFLNAYLERSGDYHGLFLLTCYLTYRTLVRAKVEAILSGQSHVPPKEQATAYQSFQDYLELAVQYNQGRPLHLIITHGLSGSGKTTLTQRLIEQLGAIRIRSDVERKRLFGLKAEDNGRAKIQKDIYNEDASQRTYSKLVELADHALEGGYPVIIDAACLKAEQRARFQALASIKRIPYTILEFSFSEATLRHRIKNRTHGASDADLTVLEYQMAAVQKLGPDETHHAIRVDEERMLDISELAKQIESRRIFVAN